ncbi:hypothetical protein EBR66_02425 [bacterium]|nr:hypothetical protein [bacterium]
MLIPPYRITLSGGGLKGIAHIGALEVLSEKGYLKSLREYVGISAGALIAFCLCIGTTLSELRLLASLLDFGLVRDLNPESMFNFMDSFGIDSGANLEKLLQTILRARSLNVHMTFQELDALKLGPTLRVIAMNLNTCLPQEFSAKLSPLVEVVTAVRASMSIPIYFSPVREPISQQYLSDGGIYFPSPFKFLNDAERVHTLSLSFSHTHKPCENITSLQEFLYQLYYSIDYTIGKELEKMWRHSILYIDCGRTNIMHFEASQEEKMTLMEKGRTSAEDFLKKSPGRRVARRFSVS